MELEVGMFIRFKDKQGIKYIRKIKNIYLPEDISYRYGEIEIDKSNHNTNVVSRKNIIKASHNIIDLIEVGDVITTINLCGEITKIDKENNKIYTTCYDGEYCHKEDIKSIVTKEMFANAEYRVETN